MLILTVSEVKGDNMKSLIAYYSRTNITRKLAEDIAEALGADIEEITTTEKYTGKIGYARAGKHAISEKIVETSKQKHDPADYDIVYLFLANNSSDEAWKSVISEYNLTGPNCVHYNLPEDQQSAIERYMGVNGYPTYKLIDKQGVIREINIDPHDIEGLLRLIEKLK